MSAFVRDHPSLVDSEALVKARFAVLQRFTEQYGLISARPTPAELELFSLSSLGDLVEQLVRAQALLPATDDLQAAYSGLNLQMNRYASELDRAQHLLSEQYGRMWTGVEHQHLKRLETRGLRILATVFDVIARCGGEEQTSAAQGQGVQPA